MWNVQTNVIPLIIGATGIISKSFIKYLRKAQNQGSMENNNIGHCTHTLESTNVKVQNVYHGKQHYIYN